MGIGGGAPGGAVVATQTLIACGVQGLISFGLAGGLDPDLRPGAVICPSNVLSGADRLRADASLAAQFGGLTDHVLLDAPEIVATAADKRRLYAMSHAHAVDLESGAVARSASAHGLPFLVLRAICDPAERTLPPAAMIAVERKGSIGLLPVLRSVLRQPGQIPDLLVLARDAASARRALVRLVGKSSGGIRTI